MDRHIEALRRYAFSLRGDTVEADDLVQECLTRALSRVRIWSNIRNVRAYLFSILHNIHADLMAQVNNIADYIPLESVEAQLISPPSQVEAVELREFARAFARLPEGQRQVIYLVGMEGLSYEEAASVLNVPIGTVMSRLSRGRYALRKLTEDRDSTRLRVLK